MYTQVKQQEIKNNQISSYLKKQYEQAIYQYKMFDKEQVEKQKKHIKRNYN